ncbi:MAG: beta-ketoacyl-[acyl-carrier-protein] synthase family protein [Bacteroidetes bacterium]|nr:beta-ketoacyl-[acyl-carrier-protein] synthase family protein [Bacteroidota bacterium]MCC7514462.1 beta-ketoacyl-[acyl-carrier-protein] synthase family protein [Bacteroidia bacterium]HCI57776.1 beta-ketoacyl-[acyl-carrier-protein] synthase family protein [Bacteroidota bacterium]HMY13477.1 beta-ketoacyl-[acyl-carrier-protein] synthase family protein [Bacteroidia bacterium]HNC32665.1 beta-ketoacyl-[acyl-carrier-protein] synthase family protein [Bacteroidia bacterium]
MKVFVTGIGVVSAIGLTVEENFRSLLNKKSGITECKFPDDQKSIYTGRIAKSNSELKQLLSITDGYYSRTSLLGIIAAEQAMGNNFHNKKLLTAFISSTSVGGMDETEKYYRQVLKNLPVDFNLTRTHDSGNTSENIAAYLKFSGYINTLSTACSSAANAIMLAARMIAQGKMDRVLVGGTDPITDFTIKGFQSLMIYDNEWCKPFDHNRNGLNLGEGAGFLLLEGDRSIKISGNEPICSLTGWHNAADAYHQTASSPDGKGATIAMKNALNKAGLETKEISYINAHGTGTKNNDLSESIAIKNVFGNVIPPFSSTKAFTGHTLAAAGAIEAVYSVLAIKNQVHLSGLNYNDPLEETLMRPVTEPTQAVTKHVMSNSFGFGGNNSSLIFSRI